MNDPLRILSWNCHSLYTKLSNFKIYLYSEKPHIACLSETWLKSSRLPNFVNYSSSFKCRETRAGGGLAILIRSDVHFSAKTLTLFPNGKLEVQAVTIQCEGSSLDILNIYNPNHNISITEFNFYFDQLSYNKLIVGDFNAHHSLWDNRNPENTTGTHLVEAMTLSPDLSLLTPTNLNTYYHTAARRFFTIDLSLANSELLPLSQVQLGADLGSDHNPIFTNLHFKPILRSFKRRPKWIFTNSAQWEKWSKVLPTPPPNVINEDCLDLSYSNFCNNIIHSAEKCFRKSKPFNNPKYSTPWWNNECNDAVRHRRHCKNLFHRHPTNHNLTQLRRAEAVVRQLTKKAKRSSLIQFSSTLNKNTPVKQVWSFLGKFAKRRAPIPSHPIIAGDQVITAPIPKANEIGKFYSNIFNSNLHSLNETSLMIPISLAMSDDSLYHYNSPFLIHELNAVLDNLKSSTPGHDDLHNMMLKNLPLDYRNWALNLINKSFLSSHIPQNWKQTIILPILKPNKSPLDVASYRPIALLPCFTKVMEKMICRRLNFVLELNNSFSRTQGGFRKRLSTHEQVARLENTIRHSIYNRKFCIALFFDLSHAYDGVWHSGLIYHLARSGVHGLLLSWLQEYLSNRKFNVLYEGEYSHDFNVSSGVPQGSILSPTLFNIMLSTIPHSEFVQTSEYADDILIFCSGSSIPEITTQLQAYVNSLHSWFKQWGFKLNEQKTKGLIFSLRPFNPPTITIGNSPIQFVTEYKYLGLLLDAPRLRWSPHIKYISAKVLKRVNVLKALSNKHWGADRTTLSRIYKAFVRSVLDYGSIFYMSASPSTVLKLDKIQNSCLRIITGAMKSSPIVSLEVESNIPPLFLHRLSTLLNYYFRLAELPNEEFLLDDLFRSNHSSYLLGWTSTVRSAPMLVRCRRALMQVQFPFCDLSPSPLQSPIPPWIDIQQFLITEFAPDPIHLLTSNQCRNIFNHLSNTKYKSFVHIYSDGSVLSGEKQSTSAGVVAHEDGFYMRRAFHLPPAMSIFSAELFAINEALKYVHDDIPQAHGIAVFSDSQSSIAALQNPSKSSHIHYLYNILSLLFSLQSRFPVFIQYVPSHRGIAGNELADQVARSGHDIEVTTDVPVPRQDKVRLANVKISSLWYSHWSDTRNASGKGKHLYLIKSSLSEWNWSSHKNRIVETSLAKLRIGHVGLKDHLFRINISSSPLCPCGVPETIPHFLLQCPLFTTARSTFYVSLNKLNVPMTLKNILGGGTFPPEKQNLILLCTLNYLRATSKLDTI